MPKKKIEKPQFDYVEIAYSNLMPLKKAADEEGMKRAKIQYSPEFVKLNRIIAQATLEQEEMLEGLNEHGKVYDEARKVFTKVLAESGMTSYREWKAKIKKVRRVDNHKLLNVLGGDIDLFLAIANVTQVALKDHAKGNADENSLLDCIEEFEQIADVEFQSNA